MLQPCTNYPYQFIRSNVHGHTVSILAVVSFLVKITQILSAHKARSIIQKMHAWIYIPGLPGCNGCYITIHGQPFTIAAISYPVWCFTCFRMWWCAIVYCFVRMYAAPCIYMLLRVMVCCSVRWYAALCDDMLLHAMLCCSMVLLLLYAKVCDGMVPCVGMWWHGALCWHAMVCCSVLASDGILLCVMICEGMWSMCDAT